MNNDQTKLMLKYYTYRKVPWDNWHLDIEIFRSIFSSFEEYVQDNNGLMPVPRSCVKRVFGRLITTREHIPIEWRDRWLNK